MIARGERERPDRRPVLAKIQKLMSRTVRAASRLEELASELELYFREFVKAFVGGVSGGRGSPPPKDPRWGPMRMLSSQQRKRLEQLAENGFWQMGFKRQEDGTAEVSIDGSRSFPLSRKLADLLEALSKGEPDPVDGFLPWKSFEEVSRVLQEMRPSLRHSKLHALFTLIYRLRVAFLIHQVNPFFIQTQEGRGVRLGLRSMLEPATGGDRS